MEWWNEVKHVYIVYRLESRDIKTNKKLCKLKNLTSCFSLFIFESKDVSISGTFSEKKTIKVKHQILCISCILPNLNIFSQSNTHLTIDNIFNNKLSKQICCWTFFIYDTPYSTELGN